jgi:hypothetical protein
MPQRVDFHPRTALSEEASFVPQLAKVAPHITEDTVRSFAAMYEEVHKKQIAPDEAREMARRVLTLYSLLARPVSCELKSLRRQKEKRRKKNTDLG